MKKLYRAETLVTRMVMAENKDDAANIADICGPAFIKMENWNVSEAHFAPIEWRDSHPLGSNTDETCGEIIKRQRGGKEGTNEL